MMTRDDRTVIDDLFARLAEAERRSPPRDRDAEAHIRQRIAEQPGAPYYMAQTLVVQRQALEAAQARIAELERQVSQRQGGLLGGLFGHSAPRRPRRVPSPARRVGGYGHDAPAGPWSGGGPWGARAGGGGFLAGAAQTALGVAGGVLLADMIGDVFGGEAYAAEAGDYGADYAGGDMDAGGDLGGDAGGDFGGGDFGGDFDTGGEF